MTWKKSSETFGRPGAPAMYTKRIFVHTSEPSSGAARYVNEFVTGLAANAADVTLFCPPTFDFIREVRSRGVNVVFAAHRSVVPAGFFAIVARNLRYAIGTV